MRVLGWMGQGFQELTNREFRGFKSSRRGYVSAILSSYPPATVTSCMVPTQNGKNVPYINAVGLPLEVVHSPLLMLLFVRSITT